MSHGHEDLATVVGGLRQTEQQIARRVVGVVGVLDDHDDRLVDEVAHEEPDGDLRQAFAQEPLLEGGGLGRVLQVEPEQDAEQRHPRVERRVEVVHRRAQALFDDVGVVPTPRSRGHRA